ncbi:MAG: hypothetical protein ABWY55_05745 [Microbacterium sp.]
MSDQPISARRNSSEEPNPFDELMVTSVPDTVGTTFTTSFRGYDKDEVDATVAGLKARVRDESEQVALMKERYRRAGAVNAQSRSTVERLEAELAVANTRASEAVAERDAEIASATEQTRAELERLKAELAATKARMTKAEQRVQVLTEEVVGSTDETPNRHQFEEILRVAEEQAGVLLRNATVQGDRLLVAAREEIQNRRKEAQADAAAIIAQAEHDAQQARLRIDTELTAHKAGIEREAAHAAEKVSQAEQEAAAIRSEAEKGAAALRSLVARETTHTRAEAEEAVRELRVRALEFEESLTRRQDDAQQEFLVLHNQAVAHAERITQDANEQVAASLDHAQRVATKAEDFERLMRAQSLQIEADAHVRAHEQLDRARDKAQKIIDMVTTHSQSVLRDAEDRTRQLRWQQHQLTSFMAEVKELIRPETTFDISGAGPASSDSAETPAAEAEFAVTETVERDDAEPDAETIVIESAEAEPEVEIDDVDAEDAEDEDSDAEDADDPEVEDSDAGDADDAEDEDAAPEWAAPADGAEWAPVEDGTTSADDDHDDEEEDDDAPATGVARSESDKDDEEAA